MSFRRALPFAVIVVLGALAYSNTLGASFHFDDGYNIVENQLIRDLQYYVSPSKADGFYLSNWFRSRYVGFLSFALNYRLHGLDTRGYQIVNIAIHIINALLVYLLVLLTFRTPRMQDSGLVHYRNHIALFSALLFVCHPVQTQAVTYISQRFASLTAMFYLGSVVAWAASRLSGKTTSRIALYIISILSAVLAMKTKEIAFTLPLAIAMYEFMFFERGKRRIVILVPLLLTMLIIPLGLMDTGASLGEMMDSVSEAAKAPEAELTRTQYLLTQFTVIPRYVYLIFFPINQNLDYDWPVYDSFLEPGVFLSFMFLVSLLGLGVYMLLRSRGGDGGRPASRLAAFGVFWFFLALSVESSVIPIRNLIFEHRVYLPSAGAFVALSAGTFALYGRLQCLESRKFMLSLPVMIVLVFATCAYARNGVWSSELSLWADVVRKAPGNHRGHLNLGVAYDNRGESDRGMEHYRIAARLKPDSVEAHNNLGNAYKKRAMYDEAIEHYTKALRLEPGLEWAHNNLGLIYKTIGRYEEAATHFREVLRINPDSAVPHLNLGVVFRKMRRTDEAIMHLKEALRFEPENAMTHLNLSSAYRQKGMDAEAEYHMGVFQRLNRPDA
jgi:tetratricopeptide (TPR) repeat protein